MTSITIPQLDANIVDVTITSWHNKVGDLLVKGECVAVLTTDKASYELEAPAAGTLLAILAPVKSIVPTGSVIGLIGQPGEKVETALPEMMHGQKDARTAGGVREAVRAASPRVRATPRARRLAQEKGFDLVAIQAALGVEIVDEAAIAAYELTTGEQK
jgi:pyruvate/2-oxoglutarate dehydrogenase complex dihydrolipoamide acyltransferase (E2) component